MTIDVTKNLKILETENTNACNFKCVFCPHEKMERKIGFMEFKLFKKIVDEVKSWKLEYLLITGLGEPLLDKNLFKKIKYARQNMPKECSISVTTNASLLDKKNFTELINAGLDELRISCYATSPESFKILHGSEDFEEVKRNIMNLKSIRESLKAKNPRICMGLLRPAESGENREKWHNFWKEYLDKFYVETEEVCNFAYGKNYRKVYKNIKRLGCGRPFSMGMILWNGDVCICAEDYEGRAVYGNVKDKGLKEIIMSQEFQKMLEIHKKGKFESIPVCDNCDQLLPATIKNRVARFKFKFLEGRHTGG